MYKIDLHTHSTASPDGGITALQYERLLEAGKLDYVAVTDHNRIDFALSLQASLGERVIVGEEIMTTQGEIIGLYLNEVVQPGQSPEATIAAIKAQGGLVYVPHPFETVRKGLEPATLEAIQANIDIIEVCNGRAWAQNRSQQTVVWARLNDIAGAASSDAHGIKGIGKTYSQLAEAPTRGNLVSLLKTGTPITDRPALRAILYPSYHRLHKKLVKKHKTKRAKSVL